MYTVPYGPSWSLVVPSMMFGTSPTSHKVDVLSSPGHAYQLPAT
jgi:hypothetical protein